PRRCPTRKLQHSRSFAPSRKTAWSRCYCQRTTASENWFLRPAGYDLETDRKRDKWVNGKALNRTARTADQIHYCQLPKELAFQDRVPTENQNPVPCARAVVRHAACIVVHIVL